MIGTFPLTIVVKDLVNRMVTSATTQIQVGDAPVAFNVNFGPAGVNWPFSQTFSATGGYGAISYSIFEALPSGLTLTGNTLSGKPKTQGTYPLTVTAKDSLGYSQVAKANLVVGNTCNASNKIINNVTARAPVWIDIDGGLANGGESVLIPPQNATTINAPLTAGTAFKPGNLITFTGTMDNANLFCVASKMTLSQGLTLPMITLANGQVAHSYPAVAVTPTGGIKPYTISVSNLPAGLSFSAGKISGTPKTAGTYTVGFSVSDSNGEKVFFNSTLVINP